jgi:hypothetical protein
MLCSFQVTRKDLGGLQNFLEANLDYFGGHIGGGGFQCDIFSTPS